MAECKSCQQSSTCGHAGKPDRSCNQELEDLARIETLGKIAHKILVLSGKGGVGKSTVAVNLATGLAINGRRVGLLDVDIHGPNVPKMLHIEDADINVDNGKLIPAGYEALKVMSLAFMLKDRDDAVIWRGPMKAGLIKQFVQDVDWGELDYLVVDCPPGTGDEPLSVAQTIDDADGAVIVTTPQDVALADVRRSITFCRTLGLPVLGVVENMSGLVCPHCGQIVEVFKAGGGEQMAEEMDVPFLGRVPLDPTVTTAGDEGKPLIYNYAKTEAAKAMEAIVRKLMTMAEEGGKTMRIAVPIVQGELCMHFGHCEQFALVNVNPESREIINTDYVPAPEHAPGLLPRWLAERGVTCVIAGGMGTRAIELFAQQGITVITGAPTEAPEAVVTAYLNDTLQTGTNICSH